MIKRILHSFCIIVSGLIFFHCGLDSKEADRAFEMMVKSETPKITCKWHYGYYGSIEKYAKLANVNPKKFLKYVRETDDGITKINKLEQECKAKRDKAAEEAEEAKRQVILDRFKKLFKEHDHVLITIAGYGSFKFKGTDPLDEKAEYPPKWQCIENNQHYEYMGTGVHEEKFVLTFFRTECSKRDANGCCTKGTETNEENSEDSEINCELKEQDFKEGKKNEEGSYEVSLACYELDEGIH